MKDVSDTLTYTGVTEGIIEFGNYYLFGVFIFSIIGLFAIAPYFKNKEIISPIAIFIIAALFIAVPAELKYMLTLFVILAFGVVIYKLIKGR